MRLESKTNGVGVECQGRSKPGPAFDSDPKRFAGLNTLSRWFDANSVPIQAGVANGIDWQRTIPYIGMQLACLAVVVVAYSV